VTVTSKAFEHPNEKGEPEPLGAPQYALESKPQHGTLTVVSPSQVTYTPNPGYTGPDSFTYTAGAAGSEYPLNPAIATVSIQVGAAAEPPPSEPPPSEPPPTEPPPAEAPPGALLLGDATATYPVAEGTPAGHEEAFEFIAKSTGTVEELQFHTNGTANTGITGVDLGIFAEGGVPPGKVLGQAKASGEPAPNSWIKATGLSVPVVKGTKYWLVALPLGSNELHFNTAVASGGVISGEALPGALLSELKEEVNWKAFNQGPVGFQALAARPGVSIEGAPASMLAGTSISLNAVVRNDSSPVIWEASRGSITSGGLYTAPSTAGGTVTITARLSDDRSVGEQRIITILPVPPSVAQIAVPLPAPTPAPSASSTGHGSTLGTHTSVLPAVARPQVELDGRTLIMTTRLGKAGRARLSAYIGHRRIGTCAVETQAGRNFTCRVKLGARVSLHTPISVWASLRVGKQIVQVLRAAAPVPRMKMPGMSPLPNATVASLAAQYICSPSMLAAMNRALTPKQATKLLPALLDR
jgi:Bacterial Ig domain